MSDIPAKKQIGALRGQSEHDRKLVRRNKNVTSAFSDREQEKALEADMERKLQGVQGIIQGDTRSKGHGKRYNLATFTAIIALRRQGLTLRQIAEMRKIGTIRLPSIHSLYTRSFSFRA